MSGLLQRLRARLAGKKMSVFPELEAGRMGRRLGNWLPSRAHVNTLIGQSGKTVVARARYLVRNNGYAMSAVDAFASKLVGAGITPSWVVGALEETKIELDGKKVPIKEALQILWARWTDECDAEGVTDFYGLQRRAARELFMAGECFIRLRPRRLSDGLYVPLQLELLPSEQLPVERNLWLENGNRVRQGIEFNKIGQRVAYHFWKVHPGDVTQSQNFGQITIVPAEQILHIHDPIESGQIRGLPRLTPAIVSLWQLDAYDDAELERKKTAALFSVFIKRNDPTPSFIDKAKEQAAQASDGIASNVDLVPGAAHTLLPGEDVSVAGPADVGSNYDVFEYRQLTKFCAAVGLPYASVSGDASKANYSSQRADTLGSRERLEALQFSVVVFQLCRPVANAFLDAAVLAGSIDLPDYAANSSAYKNINWIPPRWQWVDPLKDLQAEVIAVNAGFKPRSAVVEAEGRDPVETDNRIAADQKRAKDLSIAFSGTGSALKEVAAPPTEDDPAPPQNQKDGGDKALADRALALRLIKGF